MNKDKTQFVNGIGIGIVLGAFMASVLWFNIKDNPKGLSEPEVCLSESWTVEHDIMIDDIIEWIEWDTENGYMTSETRDAYVGNLRQLKIEE